MAFVLKHIQAKFRIAEPASNTLLAHGGTGEISRLGRRTSALTHDDKTESRDGVLYKHRYSTQTRI